MDEHLIEKRNVLVDEPLKELKVIDSSSGTFRIQNTMLHLTYKSHIDFTEWLKHVGVSKNKKGLGFPIKEFSMVHETSDSQYEHTHILVKFEKAIQSKNCRIFDYKDIHPYIQKVTNLVHWDRVVVYHTKQGKPYTMLKTESVISDVWSHDTVSDAILNMCKTTREVGGVIAAFNYKPIDYGEPPDMNWRPWQTELINELEEKPDDRTINWIWDPKGHSGKTILAKYMGMYKGAFVSTQANIYHVATQLQEALKAKHSFLTVIFNFTRQTEEHKVYQALESLKDGLVTSQKYKGTTLYFECPHVVVFANYLPDITQATVDRWKIRTITRGEEFKHEFGGKEMNKWISDMMSLKSIDRNEAIKLLIESVEADLESPFDKIK